MPARDSGEAAVKEPPDPLMGVGARVTRTSAMPPPPAAGCAPPDDGGRVEEEEEGGRDGSTTCAWLPVGVAARATP
jgi:hypothetical protein